MFSTVSPSKSLTQHCYPHQLACYHIQRVANSIGSNHFPVLGPDKFKGRHLVLSYEPAGASTRPYHYSGIRVRICQVAHYKVIHRTRFTRVVGGAVCHNVAPKWPWYVSTTAATKPASRLAPYYSSRLVPAPFLSTIPFRSGCSLASPSCPRSRCDLENG